MITVRGSSLLDRIRFAFTVLRKAMYTVFVHAKKGRGRVTLSVGQRVWVPCQVKSGPFADERMVRVSSPVGTWAGFVSTANLAEPTTLGENGAAVLVRVIGDQRFTAEPIGEPLANRLYEELIARVKGA